MHSVAGILHEHRENPEKGAMLCRTVPELGDCHTTRAEGQAELVSAEGRLKNGRTLLPLPQTVVNQTRGDVSDWAWVSAASGTRVQVAPKRS